MSEVHVTEYVLHPRTRFEHDNRRKVWLLAEALSDLQMGALNFFEGRNAKLVSIRGEHGTAQVYVYRAY